MLWMMAWNFFNFGTSPAADYIVVPYTPICWGYRRQWHLYNGPSTPYQ